MTSKLKHLANIKLDSWNLEHKPNPIGTTSKWQKKSNFFFIMLGKVR